MIWPINYLSVFFRLNTLKKRYVPRVFTLSIASGKKFRNDEKSRGHNKKMSYNIFLHMSPDWACDSRGVIFEATRFNFILFRRRFYSRYYIVLYGMTITATGCFFGSVGVVC